METPLVQQSSSKTKWFVLGGVAVVIIAATLFLGKTNLQKGSIEEVFGDQTEGKAVEAPADGEQLEADPVKSGSLEGDVVENTPANPANEAEENQNYENHTANDGAYVPACAAASSS